MKNKQRHTNNSVKYITTFSPHNILFNYIYYVKVVLRNRCLFWHCPLKRGLSVAASRMASQSPSGFASPFLGANQSLEGLYHGSPVERWALSAGHSPENGILPTSLPSFLSHRFPTDRVGLYETLCLAGAQKKRPAGGESSRTGYVQIADILVDNIPNVYVSSLV